MLDALLNPPQFMVMDRPPSQESDASEPESLFSNLSNVSEPQKSLFSTLTEASDSPFTDPPLERKDALAQDTRLKGGSTEDLPAFFFELPSHHTRELGHLHRTATTS